MSLIRLRRTRFESECEKNMVSYGVPTLKLHTHTSFTEWGAEYQCVRESECEKNMVSYGVPTLKLHTHTSFTEWGAYPKPLFHLRWKGLFYCLLRQASLPRAK